MNIKKQEYLLDLNIVASSLFIVTILVSIFLTYNEKNKLNNKTCINDIDSKKISILNKYFVIFILFIFLYTNLVNYKDTKNRGNETKFSKLQITSTIFVIISAFISLYVLKNNNPEQIVDFLSLDT